MFTGLMLNTWIAASIVAVIAGVLGFFAVLRGQSFAAHAIPNGAFAGAAGAGLLGLNVIWGLAVFAVAGVVAAAALGWGLWESRNLPFVADIGTLLAHRDVGGYTLSMSHFFDLTGPSFAALRLPAAMAILAAVRRAFKVKPLDEDGRGLTELETLLLLTRFMQWMTKKNETLATSPNSSPSTDGLPSADSITSPMSGSSPTSPASAP